MTPAVRNNAPQVMRTIKPGLITPFQGLRQLSTGIPLANTASQFTPATPNSPQYPIQHLPSGLARGTKIITEKNGYTVAQFNFQAYPINFPELNQLRKTAFLIPGKEQTDQEYSAMMLARLQSNVQSEEDENRSPTTHSRNMWLAYHHRQESNGDPHRYLLKCIKTKDYPAAQQLAAREWAVPYIGVAVGLEHFFTKTFVKVKVNEQGEKEFWIGRRFLNASSGNRWVESPADFPEHFLPTQVLIDAFAFNTMVCSTEPANSGNVLYMLDEDGNSRSKVMIDTPIGIIDNERSAPDSIIMAHLKRLTEAAIRVGKTSASEPDSAYILGWEPGKPYFGSPAWRRGESARMGRQQHIEGTLNSFDPYATVLDYRIKQGEIPDADHLYVSEKLVDNIIHNQAAVRGIMYQFALYSKDELVSDNNPFNEFVTLCEQRRSEGRRVSLADCITGFTEAKQAA